MKTDTVLKTNLINASPFSIPRAVAAILVTVIESKNNLFHAWKTATSYSILNDVEKHKGKWKLDF